MNARLSIFLIISLLLSGCQSITAPTATAIPVIPTLLPPEETTPPATVRSPTLETATRVALESTPSVQPTATLQPSATSIPTLQMKIVLPATQRLANPQPPACQPPPGNWVVYIVRRNDTLPSLGQRTGVGLRQIQVANCLASMTIFAGQHLYLPFIPPALPVRTATIVPPEGPGPGGCNMGVIPEEGPPGTIFIIVASDFEEYEPVILRIRSSFETVLEKTVQVDATGSLVEYYVHPPDGDTHDYSIDVIGTSGSRGCGFFIVPPPEGTTALPPTEVPPTTTPTTVSSVNLEVFADQEWQGTSIYALEGKTITISYVSGLWNPCAVYGCPDVDAGGWPEWNYDLILEGCPHAALIVRISTAPGDVFCAKNLFVLQTVVVGTIELSINDTNLGDDAGSITINIAGY